MATSSGHMPYRMKGQTTCVHHKGKPLDFYCEKCEELVCPKCLSSVHRGHFICELSEITPQKEPDIKQFIERTETNDLVQIGKYIASADILFKDNASIFERLSQKLKLQTNKLKHELDILTEQTISMYNKMEKDNTQVINKYKAELEACEKHLKQQVQECKSALQRGSHIQIYDTFCEVHSSTYSLPVKPVLSTADFTPNANPEDCLKEALGRVITSGQGQALADQDWSVLPSDGQGQSSTQQQWPETKCEKQERTYKLLPKTKVMGEWNTVGYRDLICPTTDGQAWTTAGGTLTLLHRKSKVIQEVDHNTFINDISLSPSTNTLWVSDNKNRISELVSGRLIQRFSTKEKPRCICITASNHVIVGMVNNVSKFTTDGKMVYTTMATGTGKPLVFSPWRISECPVSQNIAVADINREIEGGAGKGCIVVTDTDFNELFVYRGDIPSAYKPTPQTGEPFYPYGGVVYDSMGNIIIGDYYNRRVLLISGGGEFLRVIHTDVDPIQYVTIDSEDVLWISCSPDRGLLLSLFSPNNHTRKLLQYRSK